MKLEAIAEQKDVVRGEQPKIIVCDIEVSPILSWTYNAYEGNAIRIEQDPKIISFAWQELGKSKIHVVTLADLSYSGNRFSIDDKKITKALHEVLDSSDIVVGHNWDNFDMKTANARFLYYGMAPIPPHKTVDTLKKARLHFKMPKNTLDEIYRYIFGKEGKTKVKHSDVLWDCLDHNNPKAWVAMKRYNARDVEITRDVYLAMRPFYKAHPNLSLYTRKDRVCPKCQSERAHRRGKEWYVSGFSWKYQCVACHTWYRGELQRDGVEKVTTK